MKVKETRTAIVMSGIIFILSFWIFLKSPVQQVMDSNYSMLFSEHLLKKRNFRLDEYFLKLPLDPTQYPGIYPGLNEGKYPCNVQLINNHLYYWYPPGSSILSVPFVAIMNAMGVSAINPDLTYNMQGEIKIERFIAALLMAGLVVIFFCSSKLVLPLGWSVVVAVTGAFGTQVYSTASRGLWMHTWGIFLLGMALFLIFRKETKHKISPVFLASLLSWTYFVRPNFAIFILTITLYILIWHREIFSRYAITGAIWLAVFVTYSLSVFNSILPSYYRYQVNLTNLDTFWSGLAGVLISPSRGLIVFVPVLFFVLYLIIRYWKNLSFRKLTVLALSNFVLQVAICAMYPFWWGGGVMALDI